MIKKYTNYIKGQLISRFLKDKGGIEDLVVLAGMGRSGTTWLGSIVNYDQSHRMMFEPFLPSEVPEVDKFSYLQYLRPDTKNLALEQQAKLVLSGDVRGYWVDRENERTRFDKRIIKDIRCNFMLGWLRNIANNPPVILIIRHPMQIVNSWKSLGWGKQFKGRDNDLDILMSQKELLQDFPIIEQVYERTDFSNYVENVVFQWCLYHLVPLTHLAGQNVHIVYYENLLCDTIAEVNKIFDYLGVTPDNNKLSEVTGKISSTNFQRRELSTDKAKMLNGWIDKFMQKDIDAAMRIIKDFGLGEMYDSNGLPNTNFKLEPNEA